MWYNWRDNDRRRNYNKLKNRAVQTNGFYFDIAYKLEICVLRLFCIIDM